MRSVEKEGKTAEEAIEKALEELGVEREQAQIEVLSDPSRRVFSFLGGKSIKVRATALQEEDAFLCEAKELLGKILERMGIDAEVIGERQEECLLLEVKSPAAGLLIGRKGRTLDALQYLLNRMLLDADGLKRGRLLVDAEGYRSRRRGELVSFAQRSAEKAKASGNEVILIPLGSYERRIIHLALQEDPEIKTFSEGDGYLRKVHVVPINTT
jgi:spoIIIJ-associated protein